MHFYEYSIIHTIWYNSSGSYVIQLTIDNDINVPCGMNSVYVYDGLPNFISMSRTRPAHSLGVFCTRDSQYPLTIEGVTGKYIYFNIPFKSKSCI